MAVEFSKDPKLRDEAERRFQQRVRRPPRKPGRKPIPRDDLARAAQIYKDVWESDRPDRNQPVKVVANEMHLNPSTASKYVQRARAAGLLPPTEPRRAGWQQPSPKRRGS
jgi:hypothetical protein